MLLSENNKRGQRDRLEGIMKKAIIYVLGILLVVSLIACSESPVEKEGKSEKRYQVGGEEVVLKEKQLLDNKVSMLLPQDFVIMSEEVAKTKYPNENRTPIIYTNEATTINVALSHTTSIIREGKM